MTALAILGYIAAGVLVTALVERRIPGTLNATDLYGRDLDYTSPAMTACLVLVWPAVVGFFALVGVAVGLTKAVELLAGRKGRP